jgi:hypothetical protein
MYCMVSRDDNYVKRNREYEFQMAQYCITASVLAQYRVPTFYLGEDFYKGIAVSNPLSKVNWLEEKIPFAAGVFLLPKSSHFGWATWCRVQAGDVVKVPGMWQWPITVKEPSFVLIGGYHDSTFGHVVVSDRGNFDDIIVDESNYADQSPVSGGVAKNPLAFRNIVLNSLLVMLARPELVEHDGHRVRTMKKGKDPAREEWTPNWLGRTYRIQRADGDGTHASPRLHWRRGHFRQQPCGAGGKERKTIWLEPVLVGE